MCTRVKRDYFEIKEFRFLYFAADCAKAARVIYQRIFINYWCRMIPLINSCNHIVQLLKIAAIALYDLILLHNSQM